MGGNYDLVERLRGLASLGNGSNCRLISEAADEIERLRAEMGRHALVCCGETTQIDVIPQHSKEDWPWWPTSLNPSPASSPVPTEGDSPQS
jgi:hypothetical protein